MSQYHKVTQGFNPTWSDLTMSTCYFTHLPHLVYQILNNIKGLPESNPSENKHSL